MLLQKLFEESGYSSKSRPAIRNNQAVHVTLELVLLKINELVAAQENASNKMINVEEKSEQELQELSQHYTTLAEKVKTSGEKCTSIDHILDEKEKTEGTSE